MYTCTWEFHERAILAEGRFPSHFRLAFDGLCAVCRAAACLDPVQMQCARVLAKFNAQQRVRPRQGHNWVWAWVYIIV